MVEEKNAVRIGNIQIHLITMYNVHIATQSGYVLYVNVNEESRSGTMRICLGALGDAYQNCLRVGETLVKSIDSFTHE